MNRSSSNLHTSGVLLLTATVICGALGVCLVTPLLQRDSFAKTTNAAVESPRIANPESSGKYSGFFPPIADGRNELKRLEAVTGPVPPAIRKTRLAQDSRSAGHYSSLPQRGTLPAEATTPERTVLRPLEFTQATVEQQPVAVQQPVAAGHYFTPQQVPAGTVYAPVTVNVDNSALSEQIREMSMRFDRLVEEKTQETSVAAVVADVADDAEKRQDAKRQRQRNRPSVDPKSQEQIVRIEAGLSQLTKSVNSLRKQTQTGLAELTRQSTHAEAVSQLLDSYERSLNAKLQAIDTAQAATPAPSRVATAPQETYSDAVPFPVKPTATDGGSFSPELKLEPRQDFAPSSSLEVFNPETFIPRVFTPDAEIAPQPAAMAEPMPIQSALPQIDLNVAISEPALESRESRLTAPLTLDLEEAPAVELLQPTETPTTPTTLTPPAAKPSPVPLTTPSLFVNMPPPSFTPAPVPVAEHVPALPVGYEHVYRFKLADVEPDVTPHVIPGDGPVCQHCGLIHVPGQTYTHQHLERQHAVVKKIQTVANSKPTSMAAPQPLNSVMPTLPLPSSQRTNNRNAARSSNRHVRGSGTIDSSRPVWDFWPESDSNNETDNQNRPGMLQRVGATLRKFTE